MIPVRLSTFAGTSSVACQPPPPLRSLCGEEQAPGPRIPRGAVDVGQVGAAAVLGRQQRHAMRAVGVEVDARQVARSPTLVALEQEMAAVVVARVGALQAVDR